MRAVHTTLATCILLTGCAETRENSVQSNVILIVVDTLRADHLSGYGYSRSTSPYLDAFASENLRFEDVRSQAACTSPSVSSLLTSKSPVTLLAQPAGHIGVPKETRSLPQFLKSANYWTVAISASPIVRKNPSEANRFGEFDAGFDVFHEECFMSDASCVNRAALDMLDVVTEPFFLYLHYMDVHAPYGPPEEFKRRFSKNFPGSPLVQMGRSETFQLETLEAGGKVQPHEVDHFRDLYDDEIAFFDTEFGRLMDELRTRQLLDRTLVVVASDHGEAFQEQQYLGHCRIPLFEGMTATPLIMKIPGVSRTEPIGVQVQNLDITPTILDYTGFDISTLGLDGVSLRPAIEADEEVNSYTFSIQGVEVTASSANQTLTYNLESGKRTLFDRTSDPAHKHPLADPEGDRSLVLVQQLDRWLGDHPSSPNPRIAKDARRLEDELRALGYIQSAEAPSGGPDPEGFQPEGDDDLATGN